MRRRVVRTLIEELDLSPSSAGKEYKKHFSDYDFSANLDYSEFKGDLSPEEFWDLIKKNIVNCYNSLHYRD